MATEFKNKMRDLMKRAWMLVKVYGFSMADAMKQAWLGLVSPEAENSPEERYSQVHVREVER